MALQTMMHVNPAAKGGMSRRSFIGSMLAGTAGVLGWKDLISLRADEMRERGLSCILLWMGGGPSQYESFDPKPGHACMGPTKVIDSNVPGLQIGADWVKMSKMMDQVSIIRSMTAIEPDHPRATFHLHTGYLPLGGVKYPVFGANAAAELSRSRPADFDLPSFVAIGNDNNQAKKIGAGFLPPNFAPLLVTDAAKLPPNVALPQGTDAKRLERQINLMQRLEEDYAKAGNKQIVDDHKEGWELALEILKDDKKSFEVRLSVVRMMRFFYAFQPAENKANVLKGMEIMLVRSDVADVAIEDLRRLKIFDLTPQVLALYGKKGYEGQLMREAIIRYALSCKDDNAAQKFLAERRQAEPEIVRDVEDALRFEKPK